MATVFEKYVPPEQGFDLTACAQYIVIDNMMNSIRFYLKMPIFKILLFMYFLTYSIPSPPPFTPLVLDLKWIDLSENLRRYHGQYVAKEYIHIQTSGRSDDNINNLA
jgi:hypothetical protein